MDGCSLQKVVVDSFKHSPEVEMLVILSYACSCDMFCKLQLLMDFCALLGTAIMSSLSLN